MAIRIIKYEAVPRLVASKSGFPMDGPASTFIGMTFRGEDLSSRALEAAKTLARSERDTER